jgi:hypothetical protein
MDSNFHHPNMFSIFIVHSTKSVLVVAIHNDSMVNG